MLLLSACGNVSENAMTKDAITRVPEVSEAAAEATRTAGTPGAGGGGASVPAGEVAQEVTIAMHDIFFDPKEITIPANTNVKFILPNEGAAAHNFSIPDQDISVDVAPGETKDVVVNLPAGEYAFDCNVPGHKEAGMIGTLKVVEGAGGAAPAAGAEGTPAASAEATPAAAGEAAPGEAAAGAAAAEPVTIVSHDIYFEPKDVTIPANTDVKFILPNEGVTLHNFSIPDLGISVDIQPGETKEVVVNAPAGVYAFDCNVPGHKEAGMIGTLTVTEGSGASAAETAPAEAAASPAAEEAAPAEEASPAAETAAPATAAEPAAAAESVTIVSHDIFFDPKEMTIPANTDVKIILPNEGVTLHDFSIDALNIQQNLQPGETQEITINAPAGTYEYYCNIPGHKAAGMVGTLTVVAGAAAPAADAAPAEATAEQAATPAPAEEAAAPVASAEPVTVVSHDIFFDPKEITIPADTDVAFILPNEGVTIHDFSIDALGISVSIDPGATQEITINAPAGTYEYYCNIPGHKAAGMVGTLTVVADAAAPAADAAPAAATAEQAAEQAPAAEATPAAEAAAQAAAEPVTIVSHDIFFDPKDVTIPANTNVTFILPNEGVTLHNFFIPDLGIDVDIAPGKTQEVVVNAPAGTYAFDCNVPGHKEAGMIGTLTVTDSAAAPAADAAPAEATAEQAATPAAAEEAAAAAAPAAAAEPVTIVSHDIFFDPKDVTIPADTDVKISLPNEGVTLHDFSIDALGISVSIDPGATQEVVINAPAGTYEYYCNIPGHKAAGMVGTLTVK